ncbi:trehalase-like domain-containing protein [Streptomyces avermitilis]|uniref:trehalase-like domain-containing protein n=1 Tax=Streptomyces avermitilis TaxID=33903 RepID=UPI003F5409AA
MVRRIEDFGLVSDMQTPALIGRDGAVEWACLPRFDSPTVFAHMLGTALSYAPIDIPAFVRHDVFPLMEHLGLVYAACNLPIDHQDRWWLVDVNQAGQYAWSEEKLPQHRISTAIAEHLASPLARAIPGPDVDRTALGDTPLEPAGRHPEDAGQTRESHGQVRRYWEGTL